MAGNSIGKIFKLTSFGESHGDALGGVIDGVPAGYDMPLEFIQRELDRRRPGQSSISTQRDEGDRLELLSGIFQGKTTGMPIGFIVRNTDARSNDYEDIKNLFRPSHADYSWQAKYGIRDYRGGGRSSAREHISRVVAGAVAKKILSTYGVEIHGYTSQVGDIMLPANYVCHDFSNIEENEVRCPDAETANRMSSLIKEVKTSGDSIGGCVSCVVTGVPVGLGEPVFDKCQSRLAAAIMSINAAKGFEYGAGFAAASMRGSEHNDPFVIKDGKVSTLYGTSGGILGGITTGENIFFRVAFKPVPTIAKQQDTVTVDMKEVKFVAKGRHDPCVVPRAVPVVEAMTAIVILDLLLESKTIK